MEWFSCRAPQWPTANCYNDGASAFWEFYWSHLINLCTATKWKMWTAHISVLSFCSWLAEGLASHQHPCSWLWNSAASWVKIITAVITNLHFIFIYSFFIFYFFTKRSLVQWLTSVILTPLEAEVRRIMVQGQSGQKVWETLSQLTAHMVACACHPNYIEGWDQEDHGPSWIGQKARPYLKNNQSKMGWKHGSSGRLPA
jgi:hypothetical protein